MTSVVAHGTRRGYRDSKCRCDECRGWASAQMQAYRDSRKARTGLAQKRRASRAYVNAKCVECGQPVKGAFLKERPLHKVCREHVERGQRKRDVAAHRQQVAALGTSGRGAWVVGECAQCLDPFTRRGMPSRFCSTRCSRKARSTRRGWKIALRDRLAIYERDGWTCQICEEPVDCNLMATDPLNNWAPSLDHIEPQSHALIPDHSPANLRLAHRWCNSVRGDLTYYADADLRVA